jgi:hypothetical protein
LKTFKEFIKADDEAAHAKELNESSDKFVLVPAQQRKWNRSDAAEKDYKCNECGHTFRTTLDAMKRHSAEHASGNIVGVYKVYGASEGLRPTEHQIRSDGTATPFGSFYCAVIPEKFRSVDGFLKCDVCEKGKIPYFDTWDSKKRGRAVANFKNHYSTHLLAAERRELRRDLNQENNLQGDGDNGG